MSKKPSLEYHDRFVLGDRLKVTELLKEVEELTQERDAAIEALKPFGSPKLTTDEGGDWLTMTDAQGRLCIPDGHGLELVWADEDDGGTVQLTAGQLRRARALTTPKKDRPDE